MLNKAQIASLYKAVSTSLYMGELIALTLV